MKAFCACPDPLVKYADGTAYCDHCGEALANDPRDRLAVQTARAVASIERRMEALEGRMAVLETPGSHLPQRTLVTPTEFGELVGRHRNWVYKNSEALGAMRIGDGPRPRLMIDVERGVEGLRRSARDEGDE
jgi:hypothetical protein